MGKRELKMYLKDLSKDQLIDQIEELYLKYKDVKTYYDFAFNPQEDKLLDDAKLKISKEYFPTTRKRPKARRSVAQKLIKHFISLGVDVPITAELMFYNIELAQIYSEQYYVKTESFCKSIHTSFSQALDYVKYNGYFSDYKDRIEKIAEETKKQKWINSNGFYLIIEKHGNN